MADDHDAWEDFFLERSYTANEELDKIVPEPTDEKGDSLLKFSFI